MKKVLCVKILVVFAINFLVFPAIHCGKKYKGSRKNFNQFYTRKRYKNKQFNKSKKFNQKYKNKNLNQKHIKTQKRVDKFADALPYDFAPFWLLQNRRNKYNLQNSFWTAIGRIIANKNIKFGSKLLLVAPVMWLFMVPAVNAQALQFQKPKKMMHFAKNETSTQSETDQEGWCPKIDPPAVIISKGQGRGPLDFTEINKYDFDICYPLYPEGTDVCYPLYPDGTHEKIEVCSRVEKEYDVRVCSLDEKNVPITCVMYNPTVGDTRSTPKDFTVTNNKVVPINHCPATKERGFQRCLPVYYTYLRPLYKKIKDFESCQDLRHNLDHMRLFNFFRNEADQFRLKERVKSQYPCDSLFKACYDVRLHRVEINFWEISKGDHLILSFIGHELEHAKQRDRGRPLNELEAEIIGEINVVKKTPIGKEDQVCIYDNKVEDKVLTKADNIHKLTDRGHKDIGYERQVGTITLVKHAKALKYLREKSLKLLKQFKSSVSPGCYTFGVEVSGYDKGLRIDKSKIDPADSLVYKRFCKDGNIYNSYYDQSIGKKEEGICKKESEVSIFDFL